MNVLTRLETAGNLIATLALIVASVRIHDLALLPTPTPLNCVAIVALLLVAAAVLRRPYSHAAIGVAASSWLFTSVGLFVRFPENFWSPRAAIEPIPFLVLAIALVASVGRPFDAALTVRPSTVIACAAASTFLHPFGEDTLAYTNYFVPELAFALLPPLLVALSPVTRLPRLPQVIYVFSEPVVAIALGWFVTLLYLKHSRLWLLPAYYWPWFGVPAALGAAPSLFRGLQRPSGSAV